MKAFVGFAGFGLVDIALREGGYDTIGVEIDPAIAEVNQHNGGNVITADIMTLDPADFIDCDRAHFSPPCPSFSLANTAGEETDQDIALARWVARFVTVVKPEHFTLENVWLYRKSKSWAVILEALGQGGYGVGWWHLNAANYGVPQTRRRMVVIARRDGQKPAKPFPTHRVRPDFFTRRWVGWYEAIEDLIPDLPDSEFAPWQLDRMPTDLKTFLMMTANKNRNGNDNATGRGCIERGRPANTVLTYSKGGSLPRAFILGQGQRSSPKFAGDPADTVTSNTNQTGVKAFIVASGNTTNRDFVSMRRAGEPIFTITSMGKMAPLKAFIVDCQYKNFNGERGLIIRDAGNPMFTVAGRANRTTIRAGLQSGRVVSMTPRALARFQGFPDWFVLPDNRTLACLGIGNALPLGLARAMMGVR